MNTVEVLEQIAKHRFKTDVHMKRLAREALPRARAEAAVVEAAMVFSEAHDEGWPEQDLEYSRLSAALDALSEFDGGGTH